jgi:hypothetical protein
MTRDSGAESGKGGRLHYRVAFLITAMVLLGIAVLLPFSVASIVDDLLGRATGKVTPIITATHEASALGHSRVHLAVVAIDEVQLMVRLRLSGHYVCRDACDSRHRLTVVSVSGDDNDAEGLPPSKAFTLPAGDEAFSETFELPIRGHPIHYPFDRYEMVLGFVVQQLHPDGTVETLGPEQVKGRLFLSLQELLPRHVMSPPIAVDPASLRDEGDPLDYVAAFKVSFERPRYLHVLSVLLVLLIAAAAAYSVFLRPLQELFTNTGTLVLGVWGIRAILVPDLAHLTAVDLALSVVIIFLLGAITVRALLFVHDRGELKLIRRRRRR